MRPAGGYAGRVVTGRETDEVARATAARESPGRLAAVPPGTLVVAGFAVDACVHLHLAGAYDGNTAAISQGALFRVEAAAAVAAALLVLITRGRPGLLVAFLVAEAIATLAALALLLTDLRRHRARRDPGGA